MWNERRSNRLALLAALALSGCGAPAAESTTANNCGPGTSAIGGACVALPTADPPVCGDGAVAVTGLCLPELDPATCGDGTHEVAGTCVPGTSVDSGPTPTDRGPVCGPRTGLIDGACVRDEVDRLTCGEGTDERDGECVSAVSTCGDGTHIEAGVCVLDQVGAECGEGTSPLGGLCVTEGSVPCGEGTREVDGQCDLERVPVLCGADVHEEEGTCVADGLGLSCAPDVERDGSACVGGDDLAPCGDDTHAYNLECRADGRALPDGEFSLTAESPTTFADGYTLFKLAALGRGLDGLPATDRVVVRTDRPGAGAFQVAEAPLSVLGRPFWFRPCTYADDPNCAGPVVFELARADDPGRVLARTQRVDLSIPEDVPWFNQCDRVGNTLWMHGDDDHGIMDGARRVTEPEAQFFGFSSREQRRQDRVGVYVDAGDWSWNVWFDTDQLGAAPQAQVYPRVEGPAPSTNTPGLMLYSPLDNCQIVDAEVQIRRVSQAFEGGNNRTERLAMSFIADCVWPDWGRVVGCINYTAAGAQEQP